MGTCPATKPLVTASESTAAHREMGMSARVGESKPGRLILSVPKLGIERIGAASPVDSSALASSAAVWMRDRGSSSKSGGDNVRQLLGHVWVQFA